MKMCIRCKQDRPLAEFSGRHPWCLGCRRTYSRAYKAQNRDTLRKHSEVSRQSRRSLIQGAKSKPCVDCGGSFPPFAMDFDHVSGEKRRGVSRMQSYSVRAIESEIQKCDLVCANCHRVRTDQRRAHRSPSFAAFHEKLRPLKEAPCTDCRRSFPPIAMDFDHVRGEKVLPVALMREAAWGRVLEEIAKCDLVCACCHRKRTQSRLQEAA